MHLHQGTVNRSMNDPSQTPLEELSQEVLLLDLLVDMAFEHVKKKMEEEEKSTRADAEVGTTNE